MIVHMTFSPSEETLVLVTDRNQLYYITLAGVDIGKVRSCSHLRYDQNSNTSFLFAIPIRPLCIYFLRLIKSLNSIAWHRDFIPGKLPVSMSAFESPLLPLVLPTDLYESGTSKIGMFLNRSFISKCLSSST